MLFDELSTLLQSKLNIVSRTEQHIKCAAFKHLLNDRWGKTWLEIKKKNVKDTLIENYVIQLTMQHKLTAAQMKRLLSTITIGFQFRVLTGADVDYNSDTGKIQSIRGITIDNNRIRFGRAFGNLPEIKLLTETQSKLLMRDAWG